MRWNGEAWTQTETQTDQINASTLAAVIRLERENRSWQRQAHEAQAHVGRLEQDVRRMKQVMDQRAEMIAEMRAKLAPEPTPYEQEKARMLVAIMNESFR